LASSALIYVINKSLLFGFLFKISENFPNIT